MHDVNREEIRDLVPTEYSKNKNYKKTNECCKTKVVLNYKNFDSSRK